MTKLVIHIGAHKTGTKSIQSTLHRNKNVLCNDTIPSVLYPKAGRPVRIHYQLSRAVNPVWSGPSTKDFGNPACLQHWRDLSEEIRVKASDITVLSSEAFSRTRADHLFEIVDTHLASLVNDCEVVLYVRPHIERILSEFTEIMKRGIRLPCLERYTVRASSIQLHQCIQVWQDAFGGEKLTLRPFIKDELKNADVIDDFFIVVLSVDADGLVREPRRNVRANAVVLALVGAIKELVLADSYKGRIDINEKRHRQLIFTTAQDAYGHMNTFVELPRRLVEQMHRNCLADAEALDRMMFKGRQVFVAQLDKALDTAPETGGLRGLEDYLGIDTPAAKSKVRHIIDLIERKLTTVALNPSATA